MSARFGHNSRRRLLDALATAQRAELAWRARAEAAQYASAREVQQLRDRLRDAFEVKVAVSLPPDQRDVVKVEASIAHRGVEFLMERPVRIDAHQFKLVARGQECALIQSIARLCAEALIEKGVIR